MLKWVKLISLCFVLSACAAGPSGVALKPSTIIRGVDSGVQQAVDNYYSITPTCSNLGYPEIKILSMPSHGTVAVETGEVYPNFSKDNVRYECNKSKVPSSLLLYKSNPGFHGKEFFTIQVRYENSIVRLLNYSIDVL